MVHSDASLNTNKMETKVWNAAFNSHAFLHLHDSLSGKISDPACTGYIKGSFKRVDETILSQSKLPLLLCWQWPTSLSRSSHWGHKGMSQVNNLCPFPQYSFPWWRLERICVCEQSPPLSTMPISFVKTVWERICVCIYFAAPSRTMHCATRDCVLIDLGC